MQRRTISGQGPDLCLVATCGHWCLASLPSPSFPAPQATSHSLADISGAGPIGLLNLLCARAAGAHPIIMTDIVPSRLDFARTLVPTVQTIVVERGDLTGEATAAKVRELSEGGVKIALECTGFEPSIGTAVYVSGSAGRG